MSIRHHPCEETLTAYAAGSLPAALALAVGCHLELCPVCRQRVISAEAIGGVLLERLPPRPLREEARQSILRRLDAEGVGGEPPVVSSTAVSGVPRLLRRLLDSDDYQSLPWRWIGPGVQLLRLACEEGSAIMLKVGAGRRMPLHSHRGSEFTLILEGGYHDELGSFHPGDFADLDGSVEHQPVAFDDHHCICLAGLDDRLVFNGWVPRLLQPLTGL